MGRRKEKYYKWKSGRDSAKIGYLTTSSTISLLFMKPSKQIEDMFETDPDKIIENILGVDIYQARDKLHATTATHQTTEKTVTEYSSMYNVSDIDDTLLRSNMTRKDLKTKRIRMRLESILREKRMEMPKFDPNEDEIQKTTRRFASLHAALNKSRRSDIAPKSSINVLPHHTENLMSNLLLSPKFENGSEYYFSYFHGLSWPFLHSQKHRPYSLMETFIYACRAKLPYTQSLRKKYLNTYRYKMGYIFSNLRTIMDQMQWLYSTTVRSWDDFAVFPTYHHFLQVYESMIKYDLDVTDLVNYLSRLVYDHRMQYDPDYYDERPWKPGNTEP